MRVPISWLREWVAVDGDARSLGSRLTLAGFELESIAPAAPPFTGVIVAEILAAERHPQAEKLQVCRVSIGRGDPLQIVCGAPNARVGLKAALAVVGAELPGNVLIKAAKLRGIESAGMLCSARELGLAETSDGILELSADAPVGQDLRTWLDLDDAILELAITPNRGDAMSILGIAREVAALQGGGVVAGPAWAPVTATIADRVPVHLDWAEAAPRFAGRVIRGVDNAVASPAWLRERLRRIGQRSVSAVVDVTNLVLHELGQPMHAYDLAALRGSVHARAAHDGETVVLLDGSDITLRSDELVIADDVGAVGLAGVMGGQRTAVSPATRDLFLEVAWFSPAFIAGRARRHGLHTDASQRFERGVDPAGQERALERATALIVEICGGHVGPLEVTERREFLPLRPTIHLRRARLARLLGTTIADRDAERALRALALGVTSVADGWEVKPPTWRFDLTQEADLIEEVARLAGFDAIPAAVASAPQRIEPVRSDVPDEAHVLGVLAARGYHEAISYAFVDPVLQGRLFPNTHAPTLANAIASDLAQMRVSLWPGLLAALARNQHRQADRVRLIEHGTVFRDRDGATQEIDMLSGVAAGLRQPEQWGAPKIGVDFFDIKADLEALLATSGDSAAFEFVADALPCLHPGRSARVMRGGRAVGWIGELHPAEVRALELTYGPVLFEVEFVAALAPRTPRFSALSRFPQVRRDLAVVVDEGTPLSALRERVTLVSSSLLRDLRVFDVYQGAGIETGRKSVALGLIFQDNSRTLTDEEADRVVAAIVADLAQSLQARIREQAWR